MSFTPPTSDIAAELASAGVRVRHKGDSRLMRFLSFFLGEWFLLSAWTTISARTIWCPNHVPLDRLEDYETIIRHELVHARQARRWPVIWQIAYLLLPVPFLFAWCRWASERQGYLVNLRAGTTTIDAVVDTLWRRYGWCWPKPLMRRFFRKEMGR